MQLTVRARHPTTVLRPHSPPLVPPQGMPRGRELELACCVVATAAATGLSYPQARAALAQFHGPAWRGKSTVLNVCAVMYAHGVRWRHFQLGPRKCLLHWSRCVTDTEHTTLVSVRDHVMLHRNGQVLDQGGVCPVEEHDYRGRLVQDVLYLMEAPRDCAEYTAGHPDCGVLAA